jgi:hypothetical protein
MEDATMDPERFDRIAMRMGGGSSRRGMLGLLATLPVLGGLFALLEPDELAAKGRRKRRKKAHKHGKGRRRKHKKPKCKPHAKTCAGKCGPVKNNCKKTVDCGSCACDPPCGTCEICTADFVCEPCDPCCDDVCCDQANAVCRAETGACCVPDSKDQTCHNQCGAVVNNCGISVDCGSCACDPPCEVCFICDEATTTCVVDPEQQGDPCGSTGQVCQADGTCACDADSCPVGRVCVDGSCVPDPGTCTAGQDLCRDGVAPCGPGCQCVTTTSSATFCGIGLATCSDCSSDEDCTAVTGPGSVCADYTGNFCSCRQTNRRACVAPCGQCTNNAQCGVGICCDGTCNIECCTTADCGANETCEEGVCVCPGCRSRINNRCEVGDAWAQCGADGDRCMECAGGQVCAAGSQTCGDCEFGGRQRGTFCEIRDDFAKFQCAPNCACARNPQGFGACFNTSIEGYCNSGPEPICEFSADCVIEGLGTDCILVGGCETCTTTACVTRCASDESSGDGPLRLVVLD